jgi:molybdate transport system regulatory protein
VANIRLAHRLWLQDGATPVFGAGVRELLVRVERAGSLHRAASDMGMAYSKAWSVVRRAEEHLGFALLVRRAGGPGGGGSSLSDEGRWLVDAFGAMREEAAATLDDLFAKHLGDRLGSSAAPPRAPAASPSRDGAPTWRARGSGR